MGEFVIFSWGAFENKWVGHTDLMIKQLLQPQIVANSYDYIFFSFTGQICKENYVKKMSFYKIAFKIIMKDNIENIYLCHIFL